MTIKTISFPGFLAPNEISRRYLLSMSRNVRDTNRFVPQLSTVAIEKALPLIPAGKISLKSNHDTVEEEKGYYLLGAKKRA